jgi:hypothetical protein
VRNFPSPFFWEKRSMKPQLEMLEDRLVPSTASTSVWSGIVPPPHTLPPVPLGQTLPPTKLPPQTMPPSQLPPHTLPPSPLVQSLSHSTLPPSHLPPPHTLPPSPLA